MKNLFNWKGVLLAGGLVIAGITMHAQHLEWINTMGGKSVDMGVSVALDKDGSAYVTGNSTSDSFDFDTGGGYKLANQGSNDIFLGKYDPTGKLLWGKLFGGDGQDYGKAVAVDESGNVFVTGYFSNSVDFNPGGSGGLISSVGGNDLFLAKYDADGNFLWARGVGGSSTDQGLGVITDSAGSVYVTGYSGSKSIDFDPNGTSGSVTTSSQLLFLAKYDAGGTFQWVKDISGQSGQTNGLDLAVDDSNYVYITGFFSITSIDFNPGGTGGVISPSGGGRDVFAAKYSEDGDFQWVRSMGGDKTDEGNGIAVDKNGNVFLTGLIMSAMADFNPGGTGGTLNNPNNSRMAFLVKLNAAGEFQWVKGFEGSNSDYGMDVATDNIGNVFMAGYFNSDTTDFNPGGTGGKLTPVSGYDVFLAKYSTDGDFYWAKSMGGRGADYGQGVAIDKDNSVFLTGYFYPSGQNVPIDFNPGGTGGVVENMGGPDVYLAKYSCGDTSSHFIKDTLFCGGSYHLNDSVYTTSGTYTQVLVNGAGCDSSLTLALTVLSMNKPVINVDHFKLGVTEEYDTYQWLKDGVAIPDAKDSIYMVSENADYQVVVTNEYGCIDTSDAYEVTNYDEVGIADVDPAGKIYIYPNPADDVVHIFSLMDIKVAVYALDGRLVLQPKEARQVTVGELSKGLYFLKVYDLQGILLKSEKLLKL